MNEFLRKVALAGKNKNKKKAVNKTTTPKTTKAITPELYQRTTIARVTARIKLKLKGVAND